MTQLSTHESLKLMAHPSAMYEVRCLTRSVLDKLFNQCVDFYRV